MAKLISSIVVFIFGFVGLAYELDKASCEASWENSGFKVSYGFVKGCTIEVKPNVWIPSSNYREVSNAK